MRLFISYSNVGTPPLGYQVDMNGSCHLPEPYFSVKLADLSLPDENPLECLATALSHCVVEESAEGHLVLKVPSKSTLDVLSAENVVRQHREEVRLQYKQERDKALNRMVYDVGWKGRFQVRPQDQANLELKIAQGVPSRWVMEDNTVAEITIAEMQAALASGIAQGAAIWEEYMNKLDAMTEGD